MELEVGDIVLCTVERIEKTSVFVTIEGNGEGSIVTSEIAPGRIRNLRDYVVPKKKIVCKVLRIHPHGTVELSLRRVTQKETKEVLSETKSEKSYESVFKSILKEEVTKIIPKIKEKERFFDFVERIKDNPKELQDLVGKESAVKVLEILNTQRQKSTILKREIGLTTKEQNGLEDIKEILDIRDSKIKYISAGKYLVEIESGDIKSAEAKFKKISEEIEKNAKKKKAEFRIIEKKKNE